MMSTFLLMLACIAVALGLLLAAPGTEATMPENDSPKITCGVCISIHEQMWFHNEKFEGLCKFFSVCEYMAPMPGGIGSDPRKACESAGYCPAEGTQLWEKYMKTDPSNLNIRISKAHGARSGDANAANLRVSVISDKKLKDPTFDYTEQFKYRWTQFYLNTGLVSVPTGQPSTITVAGQDISVYVPKDNEGSRGVIIADPCFQSQYIDCQYEAEFDMFNRTTLMLNAINAHSDIHYWMILGDNFYDQKGVHTDAWFNALTVESKSKIFGTVPGNHDYWVFGDPSSYDHFDDQLGNGFMQYYGQDVSASVSSSSATPYDFSVSPRSPLNNGDEKYLPVFSNFFYYNTIGNVGFIGFSGAYEWNSTAKAYFEEACTYFSQHDDAKAILLMGHWNDQNLGCQDGMSTEQAYAELLKLDQCQPIAAKLRYVEGHTHCNRIIEADVGYMVAGQGMSGCGNFGFPVFDSTGSDLKVYYFPFQRAAINTTKGFDNFDSIYECIKLNGVSGCYHMADLWSSVPL